MKHLRGLFTTALLLTILAIGAAPAAAAPEGQITWAVHVSLAPTWFDPAETSGIITPYMLLYALHDAVVKPMPGNPTALSLAESWSTSPDGLAYEFVLRRGVKFHNGDPVTAEDVKFSLERYRGAAHRTLKERVAAVEIPDPGRVRIRLRQPWPDFMTFYTDATGAGWIVPKKYLEKVGGDEFNAKPVGTGPVRFVSWTKDDKVVLEANPDYFGGKIDVDRVIFRSIPETAPRIAALLKGEADVITQLPPDQGERVVTKTTAVKGALYAGLYVLAVNSKRPPLDNPLVKQALSLAIDRQAIVKELWRGRGIVPSQPIAKGDNHFDASLPPLAYNPKEARERLKKAGYKNEEIVIETTVGYTANDKSMSEAIQGMWKDVGVNAKVEVVEFSVRAQLNRDKTFKGLWWSDPTSTLGDPDGMVWRLLSAGGPQDYWRHAKWDELGEAARFSVDEKFRGGAYKEMTKIFLEHNPWIIVIQPYEDYGLQKYVDWIPNPNQQFELRRFALKMRRA